MLDIPVFKRPTTEEKIAFRQEQLRLLDEKISESIKQILIGESSIFPKDQPVQILENIEAYMEGISPSARMRVMRALFDATKIEIIAPFHRVGFSHSPTIFSALTKAFDTMPFDPVYKKYMAERDEAFVDRLLNDPRVRDVYTHRKNNDDKKREDFLRHVAEIQDDVFSHETLRFRLTENFHFEDRPEDSGGCLSGKDIFINTSEKHGWNSFLKPLRIIIHEKRHDHQRQVAQAVREGNIGPDSPFYQQGLIYMEYFSATGADLYINDKVSVDAYQAHPIEREARMAEMVARRVYDSFFEEEHSLRRSPHDPAGPTILVFT